MEDAIQRRHLDRSGTHPGRRSALRLIGPFVLVAGVLTLGWGIYDIFVRENVAFHFSPFVGMLLIFAGSVMSMMGFMGALARYQANEMLPVAKDGVNYLADGTQGAVRSVTRAMATGLREGLSDDAAAVRCPACDAPSEADSRYCDQCGRPIAPSRTCPGCGHGNDADARFCDHCGKPMTAA